MPDYLEYQKSISKELLTIKDRVRCFIKDHHWGEDGRYKEIILSHVLREHLPLNVSVGTGFVINSEKRTRQIDIIIYRNDYPLLFKQDDFVIASPESVLGIIEVKSRIESGRLGEIIDRSTDNGKIIGKEIFNGIFGFESDNFSIQGERIKRSLEGSKGNVNYLCLGKDRFVKYWDKNDSASEKKQKYVSYRITDLAVGYFISNLVEDVYISLHEKGISETMKSCFYPIENTKEAYKEEIVELQHFSRNKDSAIKKDMEDYKNLEKILM